LHFIGFRAVEGSVAQASSDKRPKDPANRKEKHGKEGAGQTGNLHYKVNEKSLSVRIANPR